MIELKITLNPETSQVTVTGPIDNKLACLAMLEEAKEIIHQSHRKPVSKTIDIAGPVMRIPNLRANGQ